MEKKTDVLVIGGGPAGMVAAVSAKKYYPGKNVIVMKAVENGSIPCGIPYMFGSLKNPDDNKLGNILLEKNSVNVVVDEAVSIDRTQKAVKTKNGETYIYEKLILAVGSVPMHLPIKGIDKKGVFPVLKDMPYLKACIEEVKKADNVLIIGGGFIGVEFADEISKMGGKKVTLVEALPSILSNSFDPDFSVMAEEKLNSKGIEVLTSVKVEEIMGKENVEEVRLSNGKVIKAESIILGVGAVPNIDLALSAELRVEKGKGIWVDEYMRTSNPDIFAVGDCASKRDFFTRRDTSVMLASTATAEARVAGANIYDIRVVKENSGTIAIYSTYIDGLVLSSAGHTEQSAKRDGFEVIVSSVEGFDKHPATLPGASKGKVKLIFSKHSGILLGGQVSCGMSCAQAINLIGIAVQKRMSSTELEALQMATHPYLTSAPTVYPVIVAAQEASLKMSK